MTRKGYRYLAGTYLLALLAIWLGVTLLTGGGEEVATAAATPPPAEDVQVVDVIQKEWQLIPTNVPVEPGNKITVKAGKVRFVLNNDGKKTHDFQVSREGFDKKSKRVRPGGARTFEVTLEPGEYVFFCPISGHRGKGMEGTLVVQ